MPAVTDVVAFNTTGVSSHTESWTIDSAATVIYVMQLGDPGFGFTPTSMTYAGTTISTTPIETQSTDQAIRVYRLTSPTTGTNDLVVNYGGSFTAKFSAFAASGVDTTTPNDTPVKSSSSSATSIAQTITSETGDLAVAVVNINGAPTSASSSDTLHLDPSSGAAGDVASAGAGIASAPGAASVDVDYSWTGAQRFGSIGLNLNAAAASGSPSRLLLTGVG